ncbi:MAG TPA: DUF192 domain-containing protein [Thermomonas sp.]|uniref:DUF192 domain-containing protein n=1 Tax=Thermomonas sp. TaxID=1971895 RepID=UPI002BD59A29|nr:DUF192 domain-containing protein [Thermomonas sp.]HOV97257.1 DUF192 domain-containing protein [Thermomonas sp.]
MRPGWIEREHGHPIPQVWAADRWWSRMRGLLARPALAKDGSQAMWITPCASVHTFGMRYALDVVYLDRNGAVVGLREHLRPWRVSACVQAAVAVEFHTGALAHLRPQRGERWQWRCAQDTAANGART